MSKEQVRLHSKLIQSDEVISKLNNWDKIRPGFLLLFGSPGVGKTVIAKTLFDRFEDIERDNATYCEMVAIWENDPRPEIDRAGWPPYNPDIKCE